jgi:hypothetical protein
MNASSTETHRIRIFGMAAFLFFGCLSALGFWRGRYALAAVFGTPAIAGLGLLLLPGPLRPVYRVWLKASHAVGSIITMIILTLAYYGLITPSALLKRLFGGRPLPLRPDARKPTYWVPRSDPAQPRGRFIKRY